MKRTFLMLGAALCWIAWAGAAEFGKPPAVETFDDGLAGWEPLAEGHWVVANTNGNRVLHLQSNAKQRAPVRRPGMYILAPGASASNVTVTVRAKTLQPAKVTRRDVCVLFGFQDDTHFYYAHISSASDDRVHNVIMRVDGTKRERINTNKPPKPMLTDDWCTISVSHRTTGEIVVTVDRIINMVANDVTYPSGRVGLGSFDDTALFDDFSVGPLEP